MYDIGVAIVGLPIGHVVWWMWLGYAIRRIGGYCACVFEVR